MARKSRIKQQAEQEGKTVPELIVEKLNTSATAQEAAAELNVAYRTLWGYMKRHNIEQVTCYKVAQ